jgi:hypothetical protein
MRRSVNFLICLLCTTITACAGKSTPRSAPSCSSFVSKPQLAVSAESLIATLQTDSILSLIENKVISVGSLSSKSQPPDVLKKWVLGSEYLIELEATSEGEEMVYNSPNEPALNTLNLAATASAALRIGWVPCEGAKGLVGAKKVLGTTFFARAMYKTGRTSEYFGLNISNRDPNVDYSPYYGS